MDLLQNLKIVRQASEPGRNSPAAFYQKNQRRKRKMYKMSFSYIGGYGIFYLKFSSREEAEKCAKEMKERGEIEKATIWKE